MLPRLLPSFTVSPPLSSQYLTIHLVKMTILMQSSLPTPRRRHLRLHRRVHLQQHPDLQPAIQSPRRRPFGGGSRGNQSSGSVSAGDLGADCNVLHGWVEGRVLDGSGSGRLCVIGQLVCALGQYQGEGVDGGGVMGRKTDQVFQECSEVGKWSSF